MTAAQRDGVLAVMAASAKRLRMGVEGPRNADLLDEWREAIAELVEADKEYDAARTALDQTFPNLRARFGAESRLAEAIARRAAALARMDPQPGEQQ